MSEKQTGGPAFPTGTGWDHKGDWIGGGDDGMTLRDYFAAKAMQVFLENDQSTMTQDAKAAYEMADAMIAVRCKNV